MTAPALLDQMGALAEEVRSRLLLLLDVSCEVVALLGVSERLVLQ